jgi:acyl transferase domain-containing protein/thioesterase domain-containing protein
MSQKRESRGQDVAVIGMAGRFPGAPDLDAYWRVIEEGRDTITRGTDLSAAIPSGPAVPAPENFVAARGVLAAVEDFDASFWGYTPREAATLDPQHRLWLELAHDALESAGYARAGHNQVISVFAGSFMSSYLHGHLIPTRAALEEFLRLQGTPSFALMVQNDPAFLPSRSAYKLNLRGPAINVQTGCSTSLVAIAQAAQSLLSYESDIALAGGVCIALPQNSGYFYQEGAITARDGYCRPYDAKACGTVFGSGGGAVALKRLADAERDGDPIHAVIRGAALNNDGVGKVSFTAPSVAGQAEVITLAQTLAEVEPDTIGYVEGHGTATPMGDPIEVEALTQAFRRKAKDQEFCCLGSVKGNVGHLDAAAGVAGFIRAVLALRRQVLPPTAHFESPNPNLRLSGSPFFVLSSARPWASASHPRRAGVSSFGIGGTNAHVVLEEYLASPDCPEPSPSANGPIELRLSTKDPAALEQATKRLAEHLAQAPEASLASIAKTLRFRREQHPNRRSVLASDRADAVAALTSPERWDTGKAVSARPKLVFAFPGQGSLRLDALARLVEGDKHFARHLAELAKPASDLLAFDVLTFCQRPDAFPEALATDNARAQTVLYCVSVALARCLGDMGIRPDIVLGHSVGEWPAAYASGQVTVEDGLVAVFHRGRLMSTAGKGAALSVKATEEQLGPLLIEGVALACVNGLSLCLVSGRPEAIDAMTEVLRAAKLRHARLPIDVAVHSPLMDPAVAPFAEILATLPWHKPSRPMLSSVTGAYFPSDVAENRQYFSRQLRAQVRFDRTIATLTAEPALLVVEVGVANTITALLTAGFSDSSRHRAITLLPVGQNADMGRGLRRVPGLLWAQGLGDVAEPGPPHFRAAMELPTYPFQRKRCWIDPPRPSDGKTDGKTVDVRPETTDATETQPRTVASRIANLISTVSGIPASTVDPSRSYIELGFDSLLLMQLEVVVQKEFGVKVTWRQLLEDHSTPAKLEAFVRTANPKLERVVADPSPQAAATLAASTPESTSIQGLTILREAGPRRLFLSYDGEGHVLQYLKLARCMPQEFSLYGLSPLRLPSIPQAHTTVEDMASHCVSIIRKKQPTGPYLFGGLCAGGVIAFEIARRMEAAGEKVDWVVLFDTINPQTRYRPFLEMRDRLKRFLKSANADASAAIKPRESVAAETESCATRPQPKSGAISKLSHVAQKLGNVVAYEAQSRVDTVWTAARIRILRQLMKRNQPWPAWLTPLGELEIFTIIKDDYNTPTINADLALVRAHLEREDLDPPAIHYVRDPLLGWRGHTSGRLEVIDTAGGHVNMMLDEPWFGEIAEKLGRLLLSQSEND